VLELWHPTGRPARRLGLGGAAPPSDDRAHAEGVDFALVAPLRAECSRAWLQQAIGSAAQSLRPDGLLCVLVSPRWRVIADRLMRRSGLEPRGGLLTVPPGPDCAHAVSFDAAALRDASTRHLGLHPTAAGCVAALARSAPGRVLARNAAPGCALLAVRAPAAEPLRWLSALGGDCAGCAAAAATGQRADAPVAVVLRFATAGRRAPDLVAKVALSAAGSERVQRERAALAGLGDSARRAGAGVPVVVSDAPALLATTALAGRTASAVIARDPAQAPAVVAAASGWLRRWTTATASTVAAGPEVLHRLLLEPAARVEAAAAGGPMSEYAVALRALAARLDGRTLVLAPAHNDLTMSNIVLLDGGAIGVVDWESACAAMPPLVDLWYVLADGVARAATRTHAQAVTALVQGVAAVPTALAGAPDERARELALTSDEALLAFHACWLQHACDELDRGQRDGPFLAVVQAVATARLRWPGAGERR
jgi:hypothetical protein